MDHISKLTCIDDCELDHFILTKTLSRFGSPYEVKCSSTGAAVLYLLSQYRLNKEKLPDIILIDIYTKELDAWGFLDELQSLYSKLVKPIEVYILSAFVYPDDLERLREYRFIQSVIIKPITREILCELIRQKESANRFMILENPN
ncbi:MAG TPA: response regulator [Mucilaginibacter sp.]|nr:response regulator [Mucilaginibacter sp.]